MAIFFERLSVMYANPNRSPDHGAPGTEAEQKSPLRISKGMCELMPFAAASRGVKRLSFRCLAWRLAGRLTWCQAWCQAWIAGSRRFQLSWGFHLALALEQNAFGNGDLRGGDVAQHLAARGDFQAFMREDIAFAFSAYNYLSSDEIGLDAAAFLYDDCVFAVDLAGHLAFDPYRAFRFFFTYYGCSPADNCDYFCIAVCFLF